MGPLAALAALAAAAGLLGPPAARAAADDEIRSVLDEEAVDLQALARDPAVVEAVRRQNARGVPLETIRAVDLTWTGDPERNSRMRLLMSTPCAERLKAAEASRPLRRESFVMDNQGALVCMTRKTSDYWQGDEDKWLRSFAGGAGAVFIDEPQADASTGSVLIQISVPVLDGGRAIGALTVGIDHTRASELARGR